MKTLSVDAQIEKIVSSINALPEQVVQAAMKQGLFLKKDFDMKFPD